LTCQHYLKYHEKSKVSAQFVDVCTVAHVAHEYIIWHDCSLGDRGGHHGEKGFNLILFSGVDLIVD